MARTRSRRSRPRATAASPPSDPTLDADLRDRPLCRPLRGPEARLGGLGQRPDSEVLAAPDLLAVVVLVITAAFERQPERVDVQLAGGGRVERDHGHAREELDLHATSSFALCWCNDRTRVRDAGLERNGRGAEAPDLRGQTAQDDSE